MIVMDIPNLSGLIAQCWKEAEESLRTTIEAKLPDRDEEIITQLFEGELRASLDAASARGAVAGAFLADLHTSFPNESYALCTDISAGLICDGHLPLERC